MLKRVETLPLPTTPEEADLLLVRVRELQRGIATIEVNCQSQIGELETAFAPLRLKHDQAVQDLKEVAKEQKAPSETELKQIKRALHAYATKHRPHLLTGKSKTVVMPNGDLSWKFEKGTIVVIAEGMAETVVNWLKRKGGEMREKYVRVQEEPNVRALGKDRPVVPHVTYEHPETFIIQARTEIPGGEEVFSPLKMPA